VSAWVAVHPCPLNAACTTWCRCSAVLTHVAPRHARPGFFPSCRALQCVHRLPTFARPRSAPAVVTPLSCSSTVAFSVCSPRCCARPLTRRARAATCRRAALGPRHDCRSSRPLQHRAERAETAGDRRHIGQQNPKVERLAQSYACTIRIDCGDSIHSLNQLTAVSASAHPSSRLSTRHLRPGSRRETCFPSC